MDDAHKARETARAAAMKWWNSLTTLQKWEVFSNSQAFDKDWSFQMFSGSTREIEKEFQRQQVGK
jgi:hypothetical protein